MAVNRIFQYFPEMSNFQQAQFADLEALYNEWNAKINVISRNDIQNIGERHFLHSLAIAKFFTFKPGTRILDLGTGGGFPGIPLAIFSPDTHFTLVDSIGKKIKVVQEVSQALKLPNVTAIHTRAEEIKPKGSFDFVVTRAVAPLDKLFQWAHPLLSRKHQHSYPNGIIALKGGDLEGEIDTLPGKGHTYTELFPIREHFSEPFFEEKWVVYVQG